MGEEVKKLLLHVIQYDLISGFLVALIISIISTFTNAESYFVGILVATINYFVSGYVISKYLRKGKNQAIIAISNFLRIGFIILTLLPFVKNITLTMYYVIGFSSHYIMLIVFSIKNRKGSV